jgi:UBX domain-containing protein 1/4
MVQTDLDALLEMGFEKERAELALKKGGNRKATSEVKKYERPRTKSILVVNAIQWMEDNQDKSLDEIKAAQSKVADDDDEHEIKANIAALEGGAEAKSLVCNECGKRFRNQDLAAYHATKRQESAEMALNRLG